MWVICLVDAPMSSPSPLWYLQHHDVLADRNHRHLLDRRYAETEPSEEYCLALLNKDTEIPEACKKYASVKENLEAKATDPFAGMSAGRSQVRNAQIKRRMSTRHGQGKEGKKSSWFG